MRLNENRNRQGQRVILVADLIDHYIETELSDETEWRAQSTRLIHADFLKRWVRPYWGMVNIRDVRTVAVEACYVARMASVLWPTQPKPRFVML
jgi:hypothetical protein